MRIVTWNVLGLTGYPPETVAAAIGRPGETAHAECFAAVFDRLEADVLALQEGVAHRLAQALARRTGRHLATFPSPQHWPGHVLSRFPVVESRTFSHAVADDTLPLFSRTAGAALLQVDATRRLWVVCLHLHPGDTDLRAREADLLRACLAGLLEVCPAAVVLGDFNCDVDEPVHTHLRDLGFANAMEAVGGGLQLTMDTAGIRPWRIDHIYASPTLVPAMTAAAVVRDPGFRTDAPRPEGVWDFSDHLPVGVHLAWP